ncbi:WD40-repeat-containing domain protein [Melampsora americana]|nr:WD40-repeat-containing domain protein [Melampsora americana]
MAILTDYERQRQENIKKNQSLLSSLSIKPLITKRRESPSSNASTPVKKRAKPTVHNVVPLKRHATRSSMRLNGQKLDPEELELKIKIDEEVNQNASKEKERLKHSDRNLVAESWRIKDEDSESLTNRLFASFSPGLFKPLKTMKQEEVNLDYQNGSDDQYDRLVDELNGMKLTAMNKVCPTRIYCMTFHPTVEKNLIFMGDKQGGVGIWDAVAENQTDRGKKSQEVKEEDSDEADAKPVKKKAEEEEEEEPEDLEPAEGCSFFIQAHPQSSVSGIQIHPSNHHLVYTSSYDSTIRELNFETKQSTEILAGNNLSSDEMLFSAFEFANEGREMFCSDNSGGISHRDLREPKEKAKRWEVSKKKIGCVSLSPISDNRWAVTAGLNREMRIWDLKILTGLSTDSELSTLESKACVVNYSHRLACSSAFFNPLGNKLLSTSYDDHLRVWDLDLSQSDTWADDGFEPSYKARHDNQTGRWVSVFKARWCPNPHSPSHFTVGNMKQKLDVYSARGELLKQFTDPYLTTVPAATAQHPSLSARIAGGTAGGKVYLWTL